MPHIHDPSLPKDHTFHDRSPWKQKATNLILSMFHGEAHFVLIDSLTAEQWTVVNTLWPNRIEIIHNEEYNAFKFALINVNLMHMHEYELRRILDKLKCGCK